MYMYMYMYIYIYVYIYSKFIDVLCYKHNVNYVNDKHYVNDFGNESINFL